ncbi:hypothetical protein RSAG8_09655, partial [Rhizoctonia solani AG-8 WAC10335]
MGTKRRLKMPWQKPICLYHATMHQETMSSSLDVNSYTEMDTDPNLVAAGMLARHLHDGTHLVGLSKVQSGNADDVPARRIPIQ